MTKVGFVFDDGFRASCLEVARLFEARQLRANFAVLAEPDTFMPDPEKGDFSLWNELQARGHVIHPHGYDHTDLSSIPFRDATAKIDACMSCFAEKLRGFDATKCIYHTTYNRTTPEIDSYLLSRVLAIRTMGPLGLPGSGFNDFAQLNTRKLGCSWHGPEPCDEHLWEGLLRAEQHQPTLFLYMLHGLNNEGWGPVRARTLERVLDYISGSMVMSYTELTQECTEFTKN